MTTYQAAWKREHPDVPVFDAGKVGNLNPAARAGLQGQVNSGNERTLYFTRTDRDRRPGKPLPPEATGDPHPDRLARAEALRQAILAKERKTKIEGSVDRVELKRQTVLRETGRKPQTPDIEIPRRTYRHVDPECRVLTATREGRVLYFATTTDAVMCLGGELKAGWVKAVQNAASGVTKTAFGWEWSRIEGRRSRRRVRL